MSAIGAERTLGPTTRRDPPQRVQGGSRQTSTLSLNDPVMPDPRLRSSRRKASSLHRIAESNHSQILLWGYFWGYEPVTVTIRCPERADYMTSSIPSLGTIPLRNRRLDGPLRSHERCGSSCYRRVRIRREDDVGTEAVEEGEPLVRRRRAEDHDSLDLVDWGPVAVDLL